MGRRGYDAVVVGARCAGSTLALSLARRGWEVALVDRATFPSDVVSTHMIYPNTLSRLEELGVMERLRDRHELPLLASRLRALGYEIEGTFTAIGDYDRSAAPRRRALDAALVDTALEAGAAGRFGERVVGLLGGRDPEDPVRGVRLSSGEELHSRWVLGADGRGSVVATSLGLGKEQPMAGEFSIAYAYWRGIPDDGYGTLHVELDRMMTSFAVEDGLHLLTVMGDDDLVRGTKDERRRKYLQAVRRFPETVGEELLDRAELASEVTVAPESLMRGFYRHSAGPGWALVGDACHFKHPATAQGICDAVEQAMFVAEALCEDGEDLGGYETWRDERSAEHYAWSFSWGQFPKPGLSEALFSGLASDGGAAQDLRDSFSRIVEPSQVMSPERRARWFGAKAGA